MKENLLEELYRMKSLVSYEKGKVISEQPLPPIGAGQLPTFPGAQQPSQLPSYPQIGMFGTAQPLVNCPQNYTNVMDIPQPEQQQKFATDSGLNPNDPKNLSFYCSLKKMSEKLAETSKSQQTPGQTTQTTQKTPFQWKQDKTFPLTYGMQGENIKKLQTAIGANPDGKFGKKTQLALDKKIQELGLNYNRKVGLDQTTFNDIVTPRKKSEPVKIEPVTNPNITTKNTTPPTQINATVPQVQIPVETPEQYYNKLVGMGLIDSVENGGNRIVYRGPVPAENVQKTLNDYLGSLGYQKTRERNPQNKDKQVVVWKK